MKPENRPSLEWRVRVTSHKHLPLAMITVHTVDKDGRDIKMWGQEWESGRPTASQLEFLAARVSDDLQAAILTSIGVQGVL